MKKNKRRIKTFKNWLLARDSASRVSTKPTYLGFFSESLEDPQITKYDVMGLFDAITDSTPFKRFFKFSGSNLGISKDVTQKDLLDSQLRINLGSSNSYPNVYRFIIFLEPEPPKSYYAGIVIEPTLGEYDLKEKVSSPSHLKMIAKIPLSYKDDKKKISDTVKDLIRLCFEGLTEEGTYQYRFLNWWIENLIFKGDEWESSSLLFENALVEWMKNADPADVQQAYVDFFHDPKGKKDKIEKSRYYLDYDTITKGVKEAIKEAGIELDGTDRGSSLLSRFDT
jgi:hypothetical protein